MNRKIVCPHKHELCEECRQVFVPATWPKINGQRLCSKCASKMLSRGLIHHGAGQDITTKGLVI
ncbi:hypothetical protein [Methanosarcina acetivorans]|uniref:hypothetical protein n=1 Tax=Methanosarcina acetivorans TaxID=2214 RepID=UPI00064EF957|nr:hypothetical protein [Methanosarcina acetivorans]